MNKSMSMFSKILTSTFTDRKFTLPRHWSNEELKKFSKLFTGSVINVSGWQDADKEGDVYKNYFQNAGSYYISNWHTEARGIQGYDNEFFLDLTRDLNKKLIQRFDVVFNHTTLEHIYEIKKAFSNLCRMSKDAVILIVPFLQEEHADYGDYWRLAPLTIRKLFEENNFIVLYLNFNSHKNSSVYIFAIASRIPEKWKGKIFENTSIKTYAGTTAISNPLACGLKILIAKIKNQLLRKKAP